MTKDEVVKLMESSKSDAEWEENCDKVKKACGGYPIFWFPAIIASGLATRITAGWGGDAEIHITAY